MRLLILAFCLVPLVASANGPDTPFSQALNGICHGYSQAGDYRGHPRYDDLQEMQRAYDRVIRDHALATQYRFGLTTPTQFEFCERAQREVVDYRNLINRRLRNLPPSPTRLFE